MRRGPTATSPMTHQEIHVDSRPADEEQSLRARDALTRASPRPSRPSPPDSARSRGQIAEHKDRAGYAGTAAKPRVAANVFGAE